LLRELQYSTDGLIVAQNALDDANRLDFESAEALGNSELRLITIFNDLKSVIPEVTEAVKNYDIETLKAAQAADTEKQALSEMEWVISQPLTKAIEEFNVSQGELQTEMGKVQGEIDELNKMEYLTPDQITELENLKTKQGELQTEYDKNATVHEEATKRIVFDMLVEKLAAEGLLTSGIFEEMAEKWGLVEDAEILTRINADKATNWLRDHPGDVEGMKRIVEGQATVWGLTHQAALRAHDEVSAFRDVVNSLTDKTITIRTIYDDEHRRASGGPVYAGQSYIVGEAGPEPFIPSVDGMILPNSAMSNYSVSTNNARNISLNMGGVNITNGMDMNAFEARLTYTIKRAMQ
jgi:hypothetical protein